MRLNTTGIAARMMLSLDKKAIGEKTHQRSSDKPDTSARSVTHKG
ncbi:protein TraE [Escherichia coli]|nr:protein TraE [Escherichia coli]